MSARRFCGASLDKGDGFAREWLRRIKSESKSPNLMSTASLAALRSKIELQLRGRVHSAFDYRHRNVFEVVSTGIPEIDARITGLPRGAMTEICGRPGSGRTSLLLSALALRTAQDEVCALIDARDSFDPAGAAAAGMNLKKLLWVRCRNIEQTLRATDLLIQSGGFSVVVVDMSDVLPQDVRNVPLNVWFRLRRAIEDTPTILMLLDQESNAKTCASLVLRLEARPAAWSECVQGAKADFLRHPFGRLLKSFQIHMEVLRSRMEPPQDSNVFVMGQTPRVAATQPETFTACAMRGF
jgi:hypothetical protein